MTIAEHIEQIDRLLTPTELGKLLSLSRKTLFAKAKAGTIPVAQLGGSIRFDPALIAEYLRDRTV